MTTEHSFSVITITSGAFIGFRDYTFLPYPISEKPGKLNIFSTPLGGKNRDEQCIGRLRKGPIIGVDCCHCLKSNSINQIVILKCNCNLNLAIQFMQQCLICQQSSELFKLECHHVYCKKCIRANIMRLKELKELKSHKLICGYLGCNQQYSQANIKSVLPPLQSMLVNVIIKKYNQSTDPNTVIFVCQGFVTKQRKAIHIKPAQMPRQQYALMMNSIITQIRVNNEQSHYQQCTSIFSFNKLKDYKQTKLFCYLCGVSYCVKCLSIQHYGDCIKPQTQIKQNNTQNTADFQNYLAINQILTCVNPKCGVAIDKEAGCFWVKCRCQWEMCYPCKVKWGDCEHFAKYPYKKFVPASDWMQNALKLF